VYCFLESAITYQLSKLSLSTFTLFVFRLLTTCTLSVSCVVHVVLTLWTESQLTHDENPLAQVPWRQYNSTDYYLEYVVSNFAEWLSFCLFAVFSSTFYKGFQKTSVSSQMYSEEE